jgi:dTDP-L-rhamnose 4-epimerase
MAQQHILVTGGAGFIGSHLVDALIAQGHKVRILDALVEQVHLGKSPTHLNPNAEFVKGDICDSELIDQALEGIDIVSHQAAEVGVGQSMYEPVRYVRANTLGTTILLDRMSQRQRIKPFKKLVVASSMSIYGEGAYNCLQCGEVHPQLRPAEQLQTHQWEVNCPACNQPLKPMGTTESKPLFPTSVYAISKQDQEQLCLVMGRAYGIPTVALRYFNVYGTRQALSNPYTGLCAIFSSRLLNDRAPLVYEDGAQSRDFIHVSDIVQANLLALSISQADYLPVNIGTGITHSVNRIGEMLASGLGKNIKAEIVGQYREGDIRHCIADINRAQKLLGFTPKVKLQDGLNDLLAWVKQQQTVDRSGEATAELAKHNLMR